MRVFAYAFKAGKWIETPRLSVRDVALLVDTEGRTIYIWHGPKSKMKDQNEAKKLLLSLRDRYSSFKFEKVGRTPAPELQQEIKRLLGSPLGQGKTRVFAITSIISGLAGVGLAIFVIYTLFSVTDATRNLYECPIQWDPAAGAFDCWLQTLTWFTGIGMIAFGIAAAMAALSKRTYMLVTLAIGLVMGIFTILYVNEWRPTFGPPGVFDLFQLLILVMEIVAFAPFTLGVVVELVKISQE